jgi:hypothetical protein
MIVTTASIASAQGLGRWVMVMKEAISILIEIVEEEK